MIHIEIFNQQSLLAIDDKRIRAAVARVLAQAGRAEASLSIAIVDDAAIQPLNARYLGHDYATDVLSFRLEEQPLEGEVIVSAQTAAAVAREHGWAAENELLLYIVHGALHLVGYDDATAEQQAGMRAEERSVLLSIGIEPWSETA